MRRLNIESHANGELPGTASADNAAFQNAGVGIFVSILNKIQQNRGGMYALLNSRNTA